MEWEQEQLRRGGHLGDETTEMAPAKPVYKPAASRHFNYRCPLYTDLT